MNTHADGENAICALEMGYKSLGDGTSLELAIGNWKAEFDKARDVVDTNSEQMHEVARQ